VDLGASRRDRERRLARAPVRLPLGRAAAALLLAAAAASPAAADSFVVPAALDFSVRDEGFDGFDQVLAGECCIRATAFQTARVRGAAEFDLSSLPPGLIIVSATLRLVLVSASGNFPLDFFGFDGDGMATVGDGNRTDVLLAGGVTVPGDNVLEMSGSQGSPLLALIQSHYGQGSHLGMLFRFTLEDPVFRDMEFAAMEANPSLSTRLLIEALPAPDPPPEVSPPGAAVPFTVAMAAPGLLSLAWEPTAGADSYRIVAGDLRSLAADSGVSPGNAAPVICAVPGAAMTLADPADSAFLLVAGENAGGIGPLGDGSPGPRTADPACP
jgi:hypothetical protein